MKNRIFAIISLFAIASLSDPGTANSFRDINTYNTPIVTNALEAIYGALAPIGVPVMNTDEEDVDGKITCYPRRTNVITNSVTAADILVVDFISNFRSGEIYFGPEFTNTIQKSVTKQITLKPDGLLFNGSTNAIALTNAPVLVTITQFLGSNLWIRVDYSVFR